MQRNYLVKHIEYLTKDLGRYNISQKLCRRFQDAIIDGRLPAGYVMPNEILASTMLSVGRSTLREAYICLELAGFITRSKAGTVINTYDVIQQVSPFLFRINTVDEFVDVMEFRYMMEGETASYVAKRATVEEMDELIAIHNDMVMARDNLEEFIEKDKLFHWKIAEFSRNKMLFNATIATKGIINDEIFDHLIEELRSSPKTVQNIINSHKAVLDCILVRDYKGASKNIREHIAKVNFLMKFEPKVVYEYTDDDFADIETVEETQEAIRNKAKLAREMKYKSEHRRTTKKAKDPIVKKRLNTDEPMTAKDLIPDDLILKDKIQAYSAVNEPKAIINERLLEKQNERNERNERILEQEKIRHQNEIQEQEKIRQQNEIQEQQNDRNIVNGQDISHLLNNSQNNVEGMIGRVLGDNTNDVNVNGMGNNPNVNGNGVGNNPNVNGNGMGNNPNVNVNAIGNNPNVNGNGVDNNPNVNVNGMGNNPNINGNGIGNNPNVNGNGMGNNPNVNGNGMGNNPNVNNNGMNNNFNGNPYPNPHERNDVVQNNTFENNGNMNNAGMGMQTGQNFANQLEPQVNKPNPNLDKKNLSMEDLAQRINFKLPDKK